MWPLLLGLRLLHLLPGPLLGFLLSLDLGILFLGTPCSWSPLFRSRIGILGPLGRGTLGSRLGQSSVGSLITLVLLLPLLCGAVAILSSGAVATTRSDSSLPLGASGFALALWRGQGQSVTGFPPKVSAGFSPEPLAVFSLAEPMELILEFLNALYESGSLVRVALRAATSCPLSSLCSVATEAS